MCWTVCSSSVGGCAGQCIDQVHYATFTISLICGDTATASPGSQASMDIMIRRRRKMGINREASNSDKYVETYHCTDNDFNGFNILLDP